MSGKRFASSLRAEVIRLRKEGVTAIPSKDLILYLDQVLESPGEQIDAATLEQYRARLQESVEDRKAEQAADLEMFRSVITAGQNALRTALIINGGATVALLAFLGKLTTENPAKLSVFANTLLIFTLGVFLTGLTSGLTYLSQWFYADDRAWCRKTGFTLNVFCIFFGVTAYVTFLCGALDAYQGFIAFE